MAEHWTYEKLDENYKRMFCPMNDPDGKITGHVGIIGVKQWFDENPEERKRHGWIKHIEKTPQEQYGEEYDEYRNKPYYFVCSLKVIDEYTVEDEWHALPLTEEMMLMAEMNDTIGLTVSMGLLAQDGNGGVLYHV